MNAYPLETIAKSTALFLGGALVGALTWSQFKKMQSRESKHYDRPKPTPIPMEIPIDVQPLVVSPVEVLQSVKPKHDDNCLFCKIIQGKIPCTKIVETDKVLGFIDIFPVSPGHCLVIPKYHSAKLNELPGEYLAAIGPLLGRVAKSVMQVTGTTDYNILQNNGANGHQAISHVHFHVIPKPSPEEGLIVTWPSKKGDSEELKELAARILAKVEGSDVTTKSAQAICVLQGDAKGSITFSQKSADEPTHISGLVEGLTPGKHGFHIHSYGDLTNGCTSAGGHFNPFKNNHGAPGDMTRHVGDLGNIQAGPDGRAVIDLTDYQITLFGSNNILGRALVVHADEDDLGKGGHDDSLTTGHAGGRVGCGIIALSE